MFEKIYVIICDKCKITHTYDQPKISKELAEDCAEMKGWKKINNEHWCPNCTPKCNCGWKECNGNLLDDTWIHSGTTIKNGIMRTWHSISCYYCGCSPSESHKDDCPKNKKSS